MSTEAVNQIKNDAYKLLDGIKELKKQFQLSAQESLKKITKEVFDASPELGAIIWTQYSPYFNDGDECVFSVNGPAFTNAIGDQLDDICGAYEYEGEDESVWFADGLYDFKNWSQYHTEHAYPDVNIELITLFSEFINEREMRDVMRDMFGEHVKVVATREGFDVSEYDHE